MIFRDPAALIALLAMALVVLFHLIRRNRETIRVSSVLLWRAPVPERRRVVVRRLLVNPNLILQLVIVALLALALADPAVATRHAPAEKRIIVVLDGSASMQARSGTRTRFELAQEAVLRLIRSLAPDGKMMVIEAAAHPTVVVPFTGDRSALERAVRSSRPTDEALDLAAALRLAGGVAAPGSALEIVSDGAFDAPPGIGAEAVRFLRVGAPARNVAITAFSIRPTVEDPATKEILLTVQNFEDAPVTTTARILLDGATIATRRFELAAGEQRSAIFRYSAHEALRAEALLDVDDDLPADNRAFAVLHGGAPLRVLLVSRGNFFLRRLLSVMPQVKADEAPFYDGQRGYDVVILDRVAPPPLESGNFLVIGTPVPNSPFDPTAYVENPEITGQDTTSPLLGGFDLMNINLKEALATPASREITPLLTSHTIPLAATYASGAVRIFYLGFDLLASDLPLRPAFPLLMANAIGWLAPSGAGNGSSWVAAGAPIRIDAPPGAYPLTVLRPDGTTETLRGSTFSDDDLVGFYRFEGKDYRRDVAVNLANAAESNLTARFSLADAAAPGARGLSGALQPPATAPTARPESPAASGAATAALPSVTAGAAPAATGQSAGSPAALPSVTAGAAPAAAASAHPRGLLSLVPILLALAAAALAGEWYVWVRRWHS